jgi:hypothetical protein
LGVLSPNFQVPKPNITYFLDLQAFEEDHWEVPLIFERDSFLVGTVPFRVREEDAERGGNIF